MNATSTEEKNEVIHYNKRIDINGQAHASCGIVAPKYFLRGIDCIHLINCEECLRKTHLSDIYKPLIQEK